MLLHILFESYIMPDFNVMNKEQFDEMMQKGYDEAQAGIGLPVDEAFKSIKT